MTRAGFLVETPGVYQACRDTGVYQALVGFTDAVPPRTDSGMCVRFDEDGSDGRGLHRGVPASDQPLR